MKTLIPIERDYTLSEAYKNLHTELTNLNIKYSFDIVGCEIKTVQCTLTDSKGKTIAYGSGKGEVDTAKMGSLFEATEHLFSKFHSISQAKIIYQNSSNFYEHSKLKNKLPIELFNTQNSSLIPLLNYKAINKSENCFYPLALICPDYFDLIRVDKKLKRRDKFNYARLENYSNNSGIAIGMNRTEAIIHGLLENIERYSLSEFLSNTFLLRKKNSLEVIDNSSLPQNVKNVFDKVQKEINEKIIIFKIPNKFNIPTFCSWSNVNGCKLGIAGYGSSLSREYAILRSIYELAQTVLLDKYIFGLNSRKEYERMILENLKKSEIHKKCAKFNLSEQLIKLGFKTINFNEITKINYSKDTKDYLDKLTEIIYSKGETPYECELNSIGKNIKVISTFITNEDRFFNVLVGKNTFPNNILNK